MTHTTTDEMNPSVCYYDRRGHLSSNLTLMKYTFKGQSHFVLNVCSVKSPKAKDEAGWSAAGTKDKGCVYHRLLSSATIKKYSCQRH